MGPLAQAGAQQPLVRFASVGAALADDAAGTQQPLAFAVSLLPQDGATAPLNVSTAPIV